MKGYKVETIHEYTTTGGWDDESYVVETKYFSTKEKADDFGKNEAEYYREFNEENYNTVTELGERYYTVISEIEIE